VIVALGVTLTATAAAAAVPATAKQGGAGGGGKNERRTAPTAYVGPRDCGVGTFPFPATCDVPLPTASARTRRIVVATSADPLVVTSGLDGSAPTDGYASAWGALTYEDVVPDGMTSVTYRVPFTVDADTGASMTAPGSSTVVSVFGCVRLAMSSDCQTSGYTEIVNATLGEATPAEGTEWAIELVLQAPAGQATIPGGAYRVDFELVGIVNPSTVRGVWTGVAKAYGGVTVADPVITRTAATATA
jgi:hypothetical protein